jgi:hypothetical protein
MASKLFQTSLFLDKISALLRNDSITDISTRHTLYRAVFSFFQALADHPTLNKILIEPRPDTSASSGVLNLTNHLVKPDYAFNPSNISSAPLRDCFTKTYRQAKAFTDLAKRYEAKSNATWKSNDAMLNEFCQTIVSLYESVAKTGSDETISSIADVDSKLIWKAFMEENKVTFTDEVLINHAWAKEFSKEMTSCAPNRLSTIGKEIANLTTSLPDGVFLKVAESRSDVMKVMIIGVEGTPYAGGLFT